MFCLMHLFCFILISTFLFFSVSLCLPIPRSDMPRLPFPLCIPFCLIPICLLLCLFCLMFCLILLSTFLFFFQSASVFQYLVLICIFSLSLCAFHIVSSLIQSPLSIYFPSNSQSFPAFLSLNPPRRDLFSSIHRCTFLYSASLSLSLLACLSSLRL